ncbi:MAG: hypothetical protein IJF87_08635 [Erysipelotrichaceae bacterium]|nr:hypothetical protein [Erysipelotrichaceae bacterium]
MPKRRYVYSVYDGDEMIFRGTEEEAMDFLEVADSTVRYLAIKGNKLRKNGYTVSRYSDIPEDQIWDLVDDDGNIRFSGNESEIARKFGFKRGNIPQCYGMKRKINSKYRIFKHGDYIEPMYHERTVDMAVMLKNEGNTLCEGRILDRTLKELKRMGIEVDISPAVVFRGDYVLTRRI